MQPNFNKKTELGLKGEQIACNYLVENHYSILERNWRSQHKEIDIIAKKGNVLYIVEVKTRSSSYFQRPQDAVTIKKQNFLISAANEYVNKGNFEGEIQFDIISVLLEHNNEIVEYIPDAFYPICK